jgi:hypothetical protein
MILLWPGRVRESADSRVILTGVRSLACFVLLVCTVIAGCGYRLSGQRSNSGQGRTIAVPTFTNQSTNYRIEQLLAEAVRLELIQRTRYNVVSESAGDVVVFGHVLGVSATPILFNEQGRASSFGVIVNLSIRVIDSQTGAVLFQNDAWTFREIFELAQNSAEFVPEDTAALDRLARRFASSFVATFLDRRQ